MMARVSTARSVSVLCPWQQAFIVRLQCQRTVGRNAGMSRCMHTGRPVFTAHGSEHALAGFMAIIDAMMSFVKDCGDGLRSMR